MHDVTLHDLHFRDTGLPPVVCNTRSVEIHFKSNGTCEHVNESSAAGKGLGAYRLGGHNSKQQLLGKLTLA